MSKSKELCVVFSARDAVVDPSRWPFNKQVWFNQPSRGISDVCNIFNGTAEVLFVDIADIMGTKNFFIVPHDIDIKFRFCGNFSLDELSRCTRFVVSGGPSITDAHQSKTMNYGKAPRYHVGGIVRNEAVDLNSQFGEFKRATFDKICQGFSAKLPEFDNDPGLRNDWPFSRTMKVELRNEMSLDTFAAENDLTLVVTCLGGNNYTAAFDKFDCTIDMDGQYFKIVGTGKTKLAATKEYIAKLNDLHSRHKGARIMWSKSNVSSFLPVFTMPKE